MRNESQAYQTLAFTPELWVSNDEDLGKAEELCKRWRPQAEPQLKRWRCEKCGEELEGQFGTCWKCAAGEEPVIADEPEAKPAEEQPFSLGPWNPFQPWMVLVLAILVVAFDLGWRGVSLDHPLKSMYYPVSTHLRIAV